jgi:hypothetical protein
MDVLIEQLKADIVRMSETIRQIESAGYTVELKAVQRWSKQEPCLIKAVITQDHSVFVLDRGAFKNAA